MLFVPHHTIAHTHGLVEKFGSGTQTEQGKGVTRIEEKSLEVLAIGGIAPGKAVAEYGTIEEHLHIMHFLLHRTLGIIVPRCESALAAFLFYQHTVIELQEVHTSLQPQHLANERGFEHHLFGTVLAHMAGKGFVEGNVDMLRLYLSLSIEVGKGEAVAVLKGEDVEDIVADESTEHFVVGLTAAVNGMVEEHAGKVSKEYLLTRAKRFETLQEMVERGMGIFLETARHSGNVNQEIRLQDNDLGIDATGGKPDGTHKIELCTGRENLEQVRPVGVTTLQHHVGPIVAQSIGTDMQHRFVPTFRHAPQHLSYTLCRCFALRSIGDEGAHQGCGEGDIKDTGNEATYGLEVGKTLEQGVGGNRIVVARHIALLGPQDGTAGNVDGMPQNGGYAVFLTEEVDLGMEASEGKTVESRSGLGSTAEGLPEKAIEMRHSGIGSQGLQLVEEVGGPLRNEGSRQGFGGRSVGHLG